MVKISRDLLNLMSRIEHHQLRMLSDTASLYLFSISINISVKKEIINKKIRHVCTKRPIFYNSTETINFDSHNGINFYRKI